MSKWPQLRLSEVARFQRGVTWSKIQELDGPEPDAVPVLRIPNIKESLDTSDLVYLRGVKKASVQQCAAAKDWILMVGSNGNPHRVGNCVLIKESNEFLFASFLVGIEPTNRERITPEFLFRLLRGPEIQRYISDDVQGSTGLSNINLSRLKAKTIECPPLPQQRRIAEILATVDEAIEQTEALVQKWQQMKAGLMHDLFTRGVTAAGQLRPTRQAAPLLYKEEPRFGWIPKEWQPDNFGDKIELVHGYQFRDYDFVEDGIPVVKIGQVTEDGLDLSSCSFVSRDRLNSFQEIQIKQGDVLMALTGATLGKTCMVEETNTDLLQNYRVGRFEPRQPETVHKGFLFALLGFSKIRRQIFDKVNSGAQGNVGKADFERVRICLPPYDEQLLIHKRLDAFQRKIKTECLAVAKLRAQKQGLMQDLLTGRVPVRVAGPAATKA